MLLYVRLESGETWHGGKDHCMVVEHQVAVMYRSVCEYPRDVWVGTLRKPGSPVKGVD